MGNGETQPQESPTPPTPPTLVPSTNPMVQLLDEKTRRNMSYLIVVSSTAVLAFLVWIELRANWNLSPFTQTIIILIVKHEIDNTGSVISFLFGTSWGSTMKSIIMGAMGMGLPTATAAKPNGNGK